MKKFVIGDIHGGLKALLQVLKKINCDKNDTLIFLGDFVDGWSESPAVLDFLIELQKKQQCIFIRGNHDELLLDWLLGNNEKFDEKLWFQHGGEATVLSYKNIDNETINKHITFLKSLQNYYLDENNRLFLHAGFSNMKGIAYEYFDETFYWDRTLWEMVMSLDKNLAEDHIYYPKRLKLYNEIFIGHTPAFGMLIPELLSKENLPSWMLIPKNFGKVIHYQSYIQPKKVGINLFLYLYSILILIR